MLGQLLFFILGGLSALAMEFTVWDWVILQPIRDLMAPFAVAVEQVLEMA